MSIDHRCRREADVRDLGVVEILDTVIPDALAEHGGLATRGAASRSVPPAGFKLDDTEFSLWPRDESIEVRSGTDGAGLLVELAEDALSDVVQDRQSPMGLAMTSRVKVLGGALNDWLSWEPVLRCLFEGRPVHEPGMVDFAGPDGADLDLDRSFALDDDPEEMSSFLATAGFLHVRDVFDESEMAAVGADIDAGIAAAEPDDERSWWAETADGARQAVRVLFFHESSEAMAALLADERLRSVPALSGDGHLVADAAEGLVKPLGIVSGLSDLPWHKDCGQGLHSYFCNSLTVGISVTGADRQSGALGVIPGSHRANTTACMRDRLLDLEPRLIETRTGDITVHCSDALHRAHPPVEQPRKVVYANCRLPPLPGDAEKPNPRYTRKSRAELTDVQDRIEAADNADNEIRYRARQQA